jgi:hypothetical protein
VFSCCCGSVRYLRRAVFRILEAHMPPLSHDSKGAGGVLRRNVGAHLPDYTVS